MTSFRALFGVLALSALAACRVGRAVDAADDLPLATLSNRLEITDSLTASRWPADPISIAGVRLVGDTIVLTVTHGGGCRDHTYQLLVGSAWMESYPVQVSARLAHDAQGDPCRALISRDLRISMIPLRDAYRRAYQTSTGQIAIGIIGSAHRPVYSF